MDIASLYPDATVLQDDSYKELIRAFEQHEVTSLMLMLTESPDHLAEQIGVPVDLMADFLEEFRRDVRQKIEIQRIDDSHPPDIFTTGDKALDKLLNGGIYTRCITEIAGESGTGKSNLLTQLAISVQLPREAGGLGRSAIYISTETGLETRRMFDMLKGIENRYNIKQDIPTSDKIHCITTTSQSQLENLIACSLPHVVRKYDAGVIIIDSIASHARMESNSSKESKATRTKSLKVIGTVLRNIATVENVAVVCSNQVSERFIKEIDLDQPDQYTQMYYDYDKIMRKISGWKQSTIVVKGSQSPKNLEKKRPGSPPSSFHSSQEVFSSPAYTLDELALLDKPKVPFLGIQWSRIIDQRIVLKRYSLPGGTRRTLEVVFSSQCKPGKLEFKIMQDGVFMVVYE